MAYHKFLTIVIVFFATITMIIISSCNFLGNSVGPHSNELIGEWIKHSSSYTRGTNYGLVSSSGFTNSWEYTWALEKGGEGKVISKTITVWDDNSIGNTSFTIEHPIKWETKSNGEENYLIMKHGAGSITDIQSSDKLREEQSAQTTLRIMNGRTDTIYFKINLDETITWRNKNSTEGYKMAKR